MHMISHKALREFARKHADSKTPLDVWFHTMSKNRFESFNALRKIFPSADKVGDVIVFNIGGE